MKNCSWIGDGVSCVFYALELAFDSVRLSRRRQLRRLICCCCCWGVLVTPLKGKKLWLFAIKVLWKMRILKLGFWVIIFSSPLLYLVIFLFWWKFLSYKIALAMNNHLQVMRNRTHWFLFLYIFYGPSSCLSALIYSG